MCLPCGRGAGPGGSCRSPRQTWLLLNAAGKCEQLYLACCACSGTQQVDLEAIARSTGAITNCLQISIRVVLYQSTQLVRAAPQDSYTSFHVPAALSSYHIRLGDLLGDRRLPPGPGSRSQGKHICREASVDCVQSCMPTGLLSLVAVPYSMYELYQQYVLHCAESLVINHCSRSFLE